MDNEFAIYNFLTGIECKNKKPTYEEAYDRAFQLAWKDMATHTLKISKNFEDEYNSYFNGESKLKIKNRKWLKEQLADIIKKHFDELLEAKNEDDFSVCHEKICKYIVKELSECEIEYRTDKKDEEQKAVDSIKKIYTHMDDSIKKTFTYGQAQKLVNMLVKYMYIYHYIYEFECPADVTFNVELYHVPIDSYVLKAIGNKNSWSKIDNYDDKDNCYKKLQTEIFKQAKKDGYNISFLWELNNWNNKFNKN